MKTVTLTAADRVTSIALATPLPGRVELLAAIEHQTFLDGQPNTSQPAAEYALTQEELQSIPGFEDTLNAIVDRIAEKHANALEEIRAQAAAQEQAQREADAAAAQREQESDRAAAHRRQAAQQRAVR